MNKILLLQKKAIRVLSGAQQLDHCRPLFYQHKIMTVNNVYIFQCLLEIKCNEDSYLRNQHVHEHDTRNRGNIFLSRYRLSKSLNCFPVTGQKFFNHLPSSVRDLPLPKFKSVVKNWLINNPFYDSKEFFVTQFPQLIVS